MEAHMSKNQNADAAAEVIAVGAHLEFQAIATDNKSRKEIEREQRAKDKADREAKANGEMKPKVRR
jgi:hypothetical protein